MHLLYFSRVYARESFDEFLTSAERKKSRFSYIPDARGGWQELLNNLYFKLVSYTLQEAFFIFDLALIRAFTTHVYVCICIIVLFTRGKSVWAFRRHRSSIGRVPDRSLIPPTPVEFHVHVQMRVTKHVDVLDRAVVIESAFF